LVEEPPPSEVRGDRRRVFQWKRRGGGWYSTHNSCEETAGHAGTDHPVGSSSRRVSSPLDSVPYP
ncbi:MAG: hypothetical protein R3324_20760, partial [Halobacteriales archaeon]|nr:hypothetical protein [Halobacteriales archaeon]